MAQQQTEQAASPASARTSARAGLDRFTLTVAIAAVAIVALGIVAVLARPRAEQPMDDSRPAGVVYNYYLALTRDDPKTAYAYLSADAQARRSYDSFASNYPTRPLSSDRPTIRIDDERIEGETARVTIRLTRSGGGLFAPSDYTYTRTIVLRRESGAWKLAQVEGIN
ncbi:MAG: hypothetical protein IT307_16165 [Chloroflexi bacterium]|nr:hypothetical protein [Chloroflexota bacterium]